MRRLRPILSFAVFFWGLSSQADWGPHFGSGGYLGGFYVGATHRSFEQTHAFDLSLGVTRGILEKEVYQLNAKYTYSPFRWSFPKIKTNIMGIGLLLTRCLCDEVFSKNLDIYPEPNYYDETAYRLGLVFSTIVIWRDFEIYWDWVLLDQILLANYNNPEMRRYPFEHWSAGIGVRIFTGF
jgi:hypothetical protein